MYPKIVFTLKYYISTYVMANINKYHQLLVNIIDVYHAKTFSNVANKSGHAAFQK
jgi:hypothetical protein